MEKEEQKKRILAIREKNLTICMDCNRPDPTEERLLELEAIPEGGTCKHFDPKFWEEKGYKQNWGDAAVGNTPHLNILRRETENDVEYLILSCHTRRPVEIYMNKKSGYSWGSY
jgi:hypothetical protein